MSSLRAVSTTRVLSAWVVLAWIGPSATTAETPRPLRILALGDSITRGSYLSHYVSGPYQGKALGLANPDGGGWRKLLQDRLRTAASSYDFVGELNYHAFGEAGAVDAFFDPDHHGLAGFGNRQIISGGIVPTPRDVLDALGVAEIIVPDLVSVLHKHRPDIILLMSGANGFDPAARDDLIRLIGDTSAAHLFVATIPPQRPPRRGAEKVDDYNASLAAVVAAQRAAGHKITQVNIHDAVQPEDLLSDGVHPNLDGLAKIAAGWFAALVAAGYAPQHAP